MSIAIVYHLYKNSKTIEDSLQSLLNQTDHDFELVLVNDGATRIVTQELKNFNLNKFKHITYYK
jgi:glycosyltransferase involved in cell wall biosynthesis